MAKTAREQLGVDLPEEPLVEQDLQEQPVEEEQRPGWLPENFESPEALASAYREAQDKIREQGAAQNQMQYQLSQMQEMLEEDRQARQQQQQMPNQQFGSPEYAAQLRDQLNTAYENDPVGTMAWLAQQYAQQTVEARFQQMQTEQAPINQQQQEQQNQMLAITVDRALGERYDDWTEYKEKVADEIRSDPALLTPEYLTSPETTMRQLSRIYETVKARDVLAQAQNGNFVNNELNQMKRQAQTISGQGARPGEPSPDEEHFNRLKAAAKGMSYSAWRE